MKKILFKKLLLDCLKFFFISIFGISMIVWVFQAVNYLDIIVEDGKNYVVYFQYTFLNFPKIIGKIFPFAMFLSFFYIIAKYENNNELLIFWIHGISKLEVINFFLKFSLILTIFQILFLTFLVPKTTELSRTVLRNSNVNFFDNFLKPKKFNDAIKGVTIYTEKKGINNKLNNIFIKKGDNEILFAKEGEIINNKNLQVLALQNGQNIIGKENKLNIFSFSNSNFNLTNLISNTNTYRKIQEISSINLFNCYMGINKIQKKNTQLKKINNCDISSFSIDSISSDIQSEFYKRMVIPLYIPLLILISLIIILISKENSNNFKSRVLIFLAGFLIIVFAETTLRFVTDDTFRNVFLIMIPIFGVFVTRNTITLMMKSNYRKV